MHVLLLRHHQQLLKSIMVLSVRAQRGGAGLSVLCLGNSPLGGVRLSFLVYAIPRGLFRAGTCVTVEMHV